MDNESPYKAVVRVQKLKGGESHYLESVHLPASLLTAQSAFNVDSTFCSTWGKKQSNKKNANAKDINEVA